MTMINADPRALGRAIAEQRRRLGWSQRRLAEAAGVSHGYIAQLELGHVPNASKARLDAINRVLSNQQSVEIEPEVELRPARTARSTNRSTNVLGTVDDVRTSAARPLPVFRWGSCGDPRDRESPPDPDRLEYPPPGKETLIGASGFGVVVKGESMAGRGIHDGDTVWVNPERPYAVGKVVLALASVEGEAGMVVKTYGRKDVGDCLVSEPAEGPPSTFVCREFNVIGPVVGITSWRLPS